MCVLSNSAVYKIRRNDVVVASKHNSNTATAVLLQPNYSRELGRISSFVAA